jgi:two-component system, LuxR family, response regulator FixJ
MNESSGTVFLVDDDTEVRDALTLLLQSVRLCVQTFASASEFLTSYDPDQPGCLVLDVHLQGMSGLTLQDELTAHGIDLPIIFLTGYRDLAVAVEAMKKGAYDFLEKPVRDQVLIDRVYGALAEDDCRRRRRTRIAVFQQKLGLLTAREREVLDLLWAGKTTRAVAGSLGISQKTAQTHRARILKKVNARSVLELVVFLHRAAPVTIQRPLSPPCRAEQMA